jgi:peptidoglycan-associated lipoprotein
VIRGKKSVLFALVVVLALSVAVFGCRTTKDLDVVVAEPSVQQPAPEPAPAPAPKVETYEPAPAPAEPAPVIQTAPAFDVSLMADVFFAFDRSDLTTESRDRLASDAKLLKAWKAGIVVEGHCDERGTNEYNLGLGERRANAVKNYLVSLGVPADNIRTISYGEERPFVKGHSEDAWKFNRRAHFALP